MVYDYCSNIYLNASKSNIQSFKYKQDVFYSNQLNFYIILHFQGTIEDLSVDDEHLEHLKELQEALIRLFTSKIF